MYDSAKIFCILISCMLISCKLICIDVCVCVFIGNIGLSLPNTSLLFTLHSFLHVFAVLWGHFAFTIYNFYYILQCWKASDKFCKFLIIWKRLHFSSFLKQILLSQVLFNCSSTFLPFFFPCLNSVVNLIFTF